MTTYRATTGRWPWVRMWGAAAVIRHLARGVVVMIAAVGLVVVAPVRDTGTSAAPIGAATTTVSHPVVRADTTFVANLIGKSVTEYNTVGNSSPTATISGSNTGLAGPEDVLLGASGGAFVVNADTPSVTEYAPGANGNVAPVATISGSNTQLSDSRDLALGPNGTLFVANNNNSITEYRSGDVGNVAPVAVISGPDTGLGGPRGMLFGPAGELFVANVNNNSVTEFAPGASGNATPIATLSGSNTQLASPEAVVRGPTGNLLVASLGNNSVAEFAPGATGNVTPVATISGAHTGLNAPVGMALGPTGDLVVSNSTSVTKYARGATGDAAPIATISGPNTGLNAPRGIAVSTAEPYNPLTPARITDTRSGSGFPNAGHTLGPGATLDVQVKGMGGVSSVGVVTAAVLNLTATNPTQAGFLTVWPTGAPRPTASNLNFRAGQTVANLAEVGVGTDGKVSIFNPAGSVDAVVDVEGFTGFADAGVGLFQPLTPARITDTRSGSGFPNAGHILGPGASLDVQVGGAGGVPGSSAGAVVLNVTATNPTAQSFLTVWPTGSTRPTASNLNFVAGQTVPNRVTVRLGPGGKVSIFNGAGSVDVVVDVGGFFTDSFHPTATGAQYTPITPVRIADTRSHPGLPGGPIGPGGVLAVAVAGVGGVPSPGVAAAVLNVTATDTTALSFLTVWPTGANRPTASDLNWVAGKTVANLVVVALGSDGAVQVFNAVGSADVVVDVSGWYA